MSCPWISCEFDGSPNVMCAENEYELRYPCIDSFVCKPYKISLDKGNYLIDVFGAEGGGVITPGKGGEIKGVISLKRKSIFYAYVGAKGVSANSNIANATFGGGGFGYGYQPYHYVGSGGGASDLRSDIDDLTSRIIVAGGGGGSGNNTNPTYENQSPGGDGSGSNGKDATGMKGTLGSGALTNGLGKNGIEGKFGFGGNSSYLTAGKDGSGGGGGYYGGNAGESYCAGGGGGSGFINKRLFRFYQSFTGVRTGHGMIKITKLESNYFACTACIRMRSNSKLVTCVLILLLDK